MNVSQLLPSGSSLWWTRERPDHIITIIIIIVMSRSTRCKGSRRGLPTKTEGVKEDFLEEGTPELSLKSRREVNQMRREERVFQADRMFIEVYVQK